MPQVDAARETLIDQLWPTGQLPSYVRATLLAVAGTALLWLSAKIQVPFWPVPMTMQTFVVLTLGMALGWRLAGATLLLYLAEGAIGLPVFAGTPEKGIGLAYMDGKLRGCDLVRLRACDVAHGNRVGARATIDQRKTGRPVQFEITGQTRDAIAAWIACARLRDDQFLFPPEPHAVAPTSVDPNRSFKFTRANARKRIARQTLPARRSFSAAAIGSLVRFLKFK